MAIIEFETRKSTTGVLARGERGRMYRMMCDRLSDEQIAAVRAGIDSMIEGSEIHTAGWMPGSDWRNTPFQPIFEVAVIDVTGSTEACFALMLRIGAPSLNVCKRKSPPGFPPGGPLPPSAPARTSGQITST